MRYFLDTEFDDAGTRIDLISLAIVGDDSRAVYAVSNEVDHAGCCAWIRTNVLPYLGGPVCSRAEIRDMILNFVGADPTPVFWGYFADYDWVLLCQLFGGMLRLPANFPHLCHDVAQLARHLGVKSATFPAQRGQEHNAQDDAIWTRAVFHRLQSEIVSRGLQLYV